MKLVFSNNDFFALVAQELADNGKVRFRVKGVSMQPLLRNERDEVLVEKDPDSLKKGDIVLFRFHGGYILHRIYAVQDGVYRIKGDNTYGAKEYCRREDILGKVTRIYRKKTGSSQEEPAQYLDQDPYTFKWNFVARFWRFRCSIYQVLYAIKRRLFS